MYAINHDTKYWIKVSTQWITMMRSTVIKLQNHTRRASCNITTAVTKINSYSTSALSTDLYPVAAADY
jgi:hypothetical protein